VGPRAGLDGCEKSRPAGIRSPDRPARSESLYRLRYFDTQDVMEYAYNLGGCMYISQKMFCTLYCLLALTQLQNAQTTSKFLKPSGNFTYHHV
jgi:hypothetical protein